jgi:hypothetical protein
MTTGIDEIVEGELVPDLCVPPAPLTLFGTSDPRKALENMGELAGLLVDVVRDRKLSVKIGGREHLYAEAWTTLGGMLGIFAIVTWTKPNESNDGYVARVEARTRAGDLVGAAEAECSRVETTWARRDPYALRSMAQTRAIGRALRAPLGQIVTLAGYQPAAAEEMPLEPDSPGDGPIPAEAKPTSEQYLRIGALVTKLEKEKPEVDWRARCRELAGVSGEMLTRGGADGLIRQLEQLSSTEVPPA